MYCVVQFKNKEHNVIEMASTTWLDESRTKVKWPPADTTESKFFSYVKKHSQPRENWGTWKVEILNECGK